MIKIIYIKILASRFTKQFSFLKNYKYNRNCRSFASFSIDNKNNTNNLKNINSNSNTNIVLNSVYNAGITNNSDLSNKPIKKNRYSNFIKITILFTEFNVTKFIETLMLNLKLNSSNTIIFQYTLYENAYQYMLGPQAGIIVKEKHDIDYYLNLYDHFNDLLESLMSRYQIEEPDFITIHLKEVLLEDTLIKNQISQIEFPKSILNVNKINFNFNDNILPLTFNENLFGFLLEDNLRDEYLKIIISKLQVHMVLDINSDKKISSKDKDSIAEQIQEDDPVINNILYLLFSDQIQNITYKNLINFNNKQGNINNLYKIDNKSSYSEFLFNNYTKFKLTENSLIVLLQEIRKLINASTSFVKVFISNNKKYIIISILAYDKYYRIVFSFNTGKLIFIATDIFKEFYDNLLASKNKIWIRTIGNNSLLLNNNNNKIAAFIQNISLKKISYVDQIKYIQLNKKKASSQVILTRNPNFGVFDIETFIDMDSSGNSYSRVFALGFVCNMSNVSMYYLTDYFNNTAEASNKLVLKCLDEMLIPEYNNFIFYVHNLGRFDIIFLQKILLDYNIVEEKYYLKPLYRDSKIIRLIVSVYKNKKQIKISFVDSLNLLNNSLETLCIDFNVNTSKGIFPYSFVNKDNLNYIGNTPTINYYPKNINSELYYSNITTNWSLRDETLKYLEKDLLSLLEILYKFQEHLWIDHNIEMTESLTISSLARTKFLKYYLKDSVIPLINQNNIFQFIYASYYGGITEVYKPYGYNLNYLDVNSLYPFAAKNPMPGNNCFWIESYDSEGLDLDKLFGVFYCEVITNNLYLGLLPVKTKSGTIFPNGKFAGIWNTIDLKFAKEKGYKIKVIKGYQFNIIKNSPFINYVDDLSLLKDTLTGSQRQVVKSLLNNLLGRFALNYIKPITKIVKKVELDYILTTKVIKTFKEINENNYIITYYPIVNKEICDSHNLDYYKVILNERKKNISENVDIFLDTSIVISSFVTSYARIFMHEIKFTILQNNGNIYYSDTDSIVTNLSLDKLKQILPKEIGNKLGQLKLEYQVREAYFISNKTYTLLLEDGKTIKRAKGVSSNSLEFADYVYMYKESKFTVADKTSSYIDYNRGSVTIMTKKVFIDWNSYKKREKIYNPKTNLWTDTRPLYIDNLTRSITIYKAPQKNIIKFHYKPFMQSSGGVGNSIAARSTSTSIPGSSNATQEDYYVTLRALIYCITILILICFYIFLLTIIPIEEWPITILNLKMSLSILGSNLFSSSFLICQSLFSFNVIHADSTDDEAENFSGSGQNTPIQSTPSGAARSTSPNQTDSSSQTPNNELLSDTSEEATPKPNKDKNVKLNLEEVNNKLANAEPDNYNKIANEESNTYNKISEFVSTKDWGHKIKKEKITAIIKKYPEASIPEIKTKLFTYLILPNPAKWYSVAEDKHSELIAKKIIKISPSIKNYYEDLMKDHCTNKSTAHEKCYKKFKDDYENSSSEENK